jgi:hypothetical protein
MAFIVEMASPIPNRDVFLYFTCTGGTWDQTLDLARQWGWQPRGTSPDPVTCHLPHGCCCPDIHGRISEPVLVGFALSYAFMPIPSTDHGSSRLIT